MSDQLFRRFRIRSVDNYGDTTGMIERSAPECIRYFSREQLEHFDAEAARFYIDSWLMSRRGEQRYREEFMLQAQVGLGQHDWVYIKTIVPLPGEDPHELANGLDDCRDYGMSIRTCRIMMADSN